MALEFPNPALRTGPYLAAFDRHTVTSGIVAAVFATTGPLALILSIAQLRGLSDVATIGWIFGGYGLGGVVSILFSSLYRLPLGMAWTIPGGALLLAALDHLSFGEVVAASFVSGLLIAVIGLSGMVAWIMRRIPMPVVMGMVAGVFLPIGLGLVNGFVAMPLLAAAMVAGFLVVSVLPAVRRSFPPILGAILAGTVVIVATGQVAEIPAGADWLVRPVVFQPEFTWRAMGELVLPLTIAVVGIQNVQGFTILREAKHEPPMNMLTVACGITSYFMAAVGSVPCTVTGPVNAVLVSTPRPERRFAGGVVFGIVIGLFGLFAPITIAVAAAVPVAFIGVLGGLAMLPVLSQSFRSGFSGGAPLGALIAFMVTVSEVKILNIGAPFWGLVFGYLVSLILDREAARG